MGSHKSVQRFQAWKLRVDGNLGPGFPTRQTAQHTENFGKCDYCGAPVLIAGVLCCDSQLTALEDLLSS